MSKPTAKKTLLILLILSLLSITAYSQDEEHHGDLQLEHKCTHDLEDKPEPELVDVEEDFTEGVEHEGRNLAGYSNLRMTGYYNLLSSTSSSYRNYLQNDLIPPILSYFSAALKNKYPVSSVRINSGVTCGHSTPSILRTGAKTDFFYMVATDSDSGSWVASSYACNLASGSKRPIVGITTINRAMLKATSNVMLHEKNMICIMHEVIHTLGFSSTLYKYFLGSNGKRLSGHVTSGSLDGRTSKVLNVSPLTSRIRSHFGCSTIKGAYMENNGNSATAGSHFERRQFSYEAMTSGLIYQMQVSEFTLALLEGSGWYIPNYSYADNFSWGQGQGCGFLMNKCSSSSFNYAGFCKSSGRLCSDAGRGAGSCSSDSKSDGCRFVHPNVNYDCDSTSAANYARLPSLQAFGRGKQSRCFTGTLSTSSGASTTSFCFKYTCSGSKLTLSVGSHSVACAKKGPVSVSGYKGTINCPDPVQYCRTTGRKFCPRNCMGRGTCNNGVCSCRSGFKGSDCALRSGF